jgi:hypothetical protein
MLDTASNGMGPFLIGIHTQPYILLLPENAHFYALRPLDPYIREFVRLIQPF